MTIDLKKVSVVLTISFIVATGTGCEPRNSSALVETKVLKMATDSGAKGSPAGNALLRWAELIEAGTNGELDVMVFYPNKTWPCFTLLCFVKASPRSSSACQILSRATHDRADTPLLG